MGKTNISQMMSLSETELQQIEKRIQTAWDSVAKVKCASKDQVQLKISRLSNSKRMRVNHVERARQIIKLRSQGLSNSEIVDKLVLSTGVVSDTISHLIKAGILQPQYGGLSEEDKTFRDKEIITLRKEGFSNPEIVDKLGLSAYVVSHSVSRLIKAGILQQQHRGSGLSKKDLAFRDEQVARMVKSRYTFKEMGVELGVVSERARIIVKEVRERRGKIFLALDGTLFTIQEAANKCGVHYDMVRKVVNMGGIDYQFRGKNSKRRLITKIGMRALKTHEAITGIEKVCIVCERSFLTTKVRSKKTCSDECSGINRDQTRKRLRKDSPTEETLIGWRSPLWQIIQENSIPDDDQWVTISQASKLANITKMQLEWLRHRGIVTIRPDKNRMWRGKPVRLYSTSQMRLVKRAIEEYQANK